MKEKEKGEVEKEIVIKWHHQLSGHEFEQTLGIVEAEEPSVLKSTRSRRVRYELVTEQ